MIGKVETNASSSRTITAPLIYIVDDEPMVCRVVDFCLKNAGYRTRVFNVPHEALTAFAEAEERPELLLTDFQMPGMTGLELIERCKAIDPNLKTISISGTLQVSEMEEAGIKPDRFIPKPFFPRELLEPVRSLLGR